MGVCPPAPCVFCGTKPAANVEVRKWYHMPSELCVYRECMPESPVEKCKSRVCQEGRESVARASKTRVGERLRRIVAGVPLTKCCLIRPFSTWPPGPGR